VRIGKIVGAHGIHGAVKVYSYAESPECFSQSQGFQAIDTAGREFQCDVLWARSQKNVVCMGLKGVTTRDQAQALAGCELMIPRQSLPPVDDGTNYWIDIIGMAVYGTDDAYLGRVSNIIATGANDVYVVKTPEGYPVEEILLPAIASVVLQVDVQHQRMVVELPDGLI
jgi:16S rRNA processing protein RimM